MARGEWSFYRVVMSVIRQKVGDTALADDLYQESFCIVLEKIRHGDVREAEKLTGFINQIYLRQSKLCR